MKGKAVLLTTLLITFCGALFGQKSLPLDSPAFEIEVDEVCNFKLQFGNDFNQLDSVVRASLNLPPQHSIKYHFKFLLNKSTLDSTYIIKPFLDYVKPENDSVKYSRMEYLNLADQLKIQAIDLGGCSLHQLWYTIPINFKRE